jgi:hypothetical protein
LRSASPDPKAVFSPERWAEIAKAVSADTILLNEKRAIGDAIIEYHFACQANERAADEADKKRPTRRKVDPRAKGRAALRNFIEYTRGLRIALSSVQNYLKHEVSINEAQQLIDRIYKFQELAKRELDEKSRGGRPQQTIRDNLVIQLGVIYERLTGKKPTRTVDRNGRIGGRFWKFVYAIFRAQHIPTDGLPNAIEKAARYAKNQH